MPEEIFKLTLHALTPPRFNFSLLTTHALRITTHDSPITHYAFTPKNPSEMIIKANNYVILQFNYKLS